MSVEILRRGMIRPITDLPTAPSTAGEIEIEIGGRFYQVDASRIGGGGGVFGQTVIQLPLAANFTDDVGHAVTESGSVAIDPSTTPGSALFSGSGGVIHVAQATPVNDFELSASPFTIQGWFKTSQAAQQDTCLIERDPGTFASGSWAILINTNSASDGKVSFWSSAEDGANPVVVSTAAYNDGVRHGVTVVHTGAEYLLYLDNALVARKRYSSVADYGDLTAEIKLGNSVYATRDFLGNLDNWRIVKGIPVYTARVFAAPTLPFPTS